MNGLREGWRDDSGGLDRHGSGEKRVDSGYISVKEFLIFADRLNRDPLGANGV